MTKSIDLSDADAFKIFTKFISPLHKVLSISIPLMITIFSLFNWYTFDKLETHEVGILIAVSIISWTISGIFTWLKIHEAPDFVTMYGSLVWTNELPITLKMINSAQSHFLNSLVKDKLVKQSALQQIFNHNRIQFVDKSIVYSKGLANGLAYTNHGVIIVRWLNGFKVNAFFHENMHFVQNLLWHTPDSGHVIKRDWDLVSEMKRTFVE